ncbi:hypothetical protein QBC32DRAFT_91216 [Pseudoneurospora amorphoporcata]|uniref:N-acetyltransferase ESCO zinc-finger domain-containing protein n=1 Tax=Pseudoneurospora amorphoporcata TaxID=241081 RepID=A0AAN6NNK2_9PEZI|nr:hypothetical protein QBC32DRAFT_91216 [Pseudoneurospora amorphoporcata]
MSAETLGTNHSTQQRKKPIRTYGRRSVAAAAAAAKQDSKPSTPRQLSPQNTPAPELPPPSSPTTVPTSVECPKPTKSGSILSYFKAKPKTPAPPSKATTPAPSATEELISTPPSPPPSSTAQRKRRRLTTRPTLDGEHDGENQDTKRRNHQNGDETPEAGHGTPIGTPSASSQTEPDSKQSVGKKKRAAKTPPTKEMVQTTLSLAIGEPKPQFIVCKECSMLYNHLNDKDRRDHKRVHAAYIRSKNKKNTT